jgi:hypothetical protein
MAEDRRSVTDIFGFSSEEGSVSFFFFVIVSKRVSGNGVEK